ncbi:hypothetical protein RSAG8_03509, partial [Rhizoctonia solani AG-8 WAC10335]
MAHRITSAGTKHPSPKLPLCCEHARTTSRSRQ